MPENGKKFRSASSESLIMSKQEFRKFRRLRSEVERFGRKIKKKHARELQRISLGLLWEYDPIYWSDCPHSSNLADVVWERESEKKWRTR